MEFHITFFIDKSTQNEQSAYHCSAMQQYSLEKSEREWNDK